jgi:hypothetical protein
MSERFPAPWRAEMIPGGFAVRDAAGRLVAHVYGNAHRIEGAPRTLSLDQAKEMANLIVKLRELKNSAVTA